MNTSIEWDTVCTGLWDNSRDNIRHALDHLRELRGLSSWNDNSDRGHHFKWAIVSVHQAAECFCNILFIKKNPGDSALFDNKGRLRLPYLNKILQLLQQSKNIFLSPSEKMFIDLLK